MLPLARTGAPEESYFTFTYSPIRDESGGVGGVFCAVVETTDKVIEERRLRLLNALAAGGARADAGGGLRAMPRRRSRGRRTTSPSRSSTCRRRRHRDARRRGEHRPGSALAPARSARRRRAVAVRGGHGRCRVVPLTDGPGGARGAVILPIEHSGGGRALRASSSRGLSPLLSQTASYTRFHTLLAASISQASAVPRHTRKRAQAGRGAGRARSREDRVLQQREPRVPDAAHADARPGGGRARRARTRSRRRSASAGRCVHRNALRLLEARQRAARLLAHRSRPRRGVVRADRPRRAHERARQHVPLGDRARRPAARLDLPPLEEPAYVDREMWEKIVLNLLSNALKFTFDGEIAVSLRLVGEDFELVVRDTGIGIARRGTAAASSIGFIASKARAPARTKGRASGWRSFAELVKLHGGRVRVESVEGEGTHVLGPDPARPRAPAAERIGARADAALDGHRCRALRRGGAALDCATATVADAGQPARRHSRRRASRARIVLADDNADMREYLAACCGSAGTSRRSPNGDAALAADSASASRSRPRRRDDAGARRVRTAARDPERPGAAAPPVILLSARAGEEATAEGLSAGRQRLHREAVLGARALVRVASTLAVAGRRARGARDRGGRARASVRPLHAGAVSDRRAARPRPRHRARQPALRSGLGQGRAASSASRIIDGIPELGGQPFLGYLDDVFRTGVAYEARGELARLARSSDGELEDVYFDFVYAPLRDAAASIDGILVCGFEVTRRSARQGAGAPPGEHRGERAPVPRAGREPP